MIIIKTIQQQWDEYAKLAVPEFATLDQYQVMERTFRAGILAMMITNLQLADLTEDEAIKKLTELDTENQEWWLAQKLIGGAG